MADSAVSLEYVCTGCSCSPHSCAWNSNGLVAFASNRTVSIYSAANDDHRRVVSTLQAHTGRVNCVTWIARDDAQNQHCDDNDGSSCELVSGSVDKQVLVWSLKTEETATGCPGVAVRKMQVLAQHTDVVVSLSSCTIHSTTWLASTGADCNVCMWRRTSPEADFELVQTLVCGRRGFVLDVSMARLPDTKQPMLACGCDDFHIYLWTLDNADTDQWRLVQQLVGHEDWVRTVDFAHGCGGGGDSGDAVPSLLLASGAQDSYVRVWRVTANRPADALAADEVPEIRLRENTFSVQERQYSVMLDAVLAGHEHWLYSVSWQPAVRREDGSMHQPLSLVSASMDKTVIVWRFNDDAGVWLDEARMGDIGGNTLGFYGATFSECGQWILAHGYQGAFHLWRRGARDTHTWQPQVTVSGHFGPVFDLAWAPDGFLLSVSKDQTCRLHCEWTRPSSAKSASSSETTTVTMTTSWHEIARPQIHGYDLQCLAMTSPFQYACGADEKVIRVFSAPALLLKSMTNIAGRQVRSSAELPLGATVPALGLSNKAVYSAEDVASAQQDDDENFGAADVNRLPAFSAAEKTVPPFEEDLLQNTLWPETQKLYGHGYELYTVASDGRHMLASACKASKAEHAAVKVWDVASWRCLGTLQYHNLTVTQLSFSPDGTHLLAVSRDRMWSLWRRDASTADAAFTLVAGTQKASSVHQRVIWSCHWSPDGVLFATGSRDKRVALWSADKDMLHLDTRSSESPPYVDCGVGWGLASAALELEDSVTAVQFAPMAAAMPASQTSYRLAVGLETGHVVLTSWCRDNQWTVTHRVEDSLCPVLTVQRLAWRPAAKVADDREPSQSEVGRQHQHWQLAVASADHSVRVLTFAESFFTS